MKSEAPVRAASKSATPRVQSRAGRLALLIIALLLGLFYVMSGSQKLLNAETMANIPYAEQFVLWGYPPWFRFVVGTAEVLGGIGLLVPAVRFYAASGLVFVMLGAAMTHLRVAEYAVLPFPLVMGALLATVAYFARPARLPFLPRTRSK